MKETKFVCQIMNDDCIKKKQEEKKNEKRPLSHDKSVTEK